MNLPDRSAIVALNSDGGNLLASLIIGEYVHTKGFVTFVPDNETCASGCAAIWVAGRVRNVAPTARVGFHAAYDANTGVEKGNLNALFGSYLARIGIGVEAIVYMTSAAPDGMQWLSKEDADRLGISYNILQLDSQQQTFVRTPSPTTAPPSRSSQDLDQRCIPPPPAGIPAWRQAQWPRAIQTLLKYPEETAEFDKRYSPQGRPGLGKQILAMLSGSVPLVCYDQPGGGRKRDGGSAAVASPFSKWWEALGRH
jgi:hypothetical protein